MNGSMVMGIFIIVFLIISLLSLIREIILRRNAKKLDKNYLKQTGALNFIYANHYRGLNYGEDMECTIYLYRNLIKIVPIIAIGDREINLKDCISFNFYPIEDLKNMFLEENKIKFIGQDDLHKNLRDPKKNKYKGIDGVVSVEYFDEKNIKEISFLYRENLSKVIKFKENILELKNDTIDLS